MKQSFNSFNFAGDFHDSKRAALRVGLAPTSTGIVPLSATGGTPVCVGVTRGGITAEDSVPPVYSFGRGDARFSFRVVGVNKHLRLVTCVCLISRQDFSHKPVVAAFGRGFEAEGCSVGLSRRRELRFIPQHDEAHPPRWAAERKRARPCQRIPPGTSWPRGCIESPSPLRKSFPA